MGTSPQTGLPLATAIQKGRVLPQGAKAVNLGSGPQILNVGDQVNSADGTGWHVVIKTHLGPVEALRPGESNDLYHWSTGAS